MSFGSSETDAACFLLDDKRWFRCLSEAGHQPRPALFLDRDGTVIEECNYLADPDGVVLIDGAAEALRRAREIGMAIVIVTNQSGIGRGYFGWQDYFAVENRFLDLLQQERVKADAVLACGDLPRAGSLGSSWRKPNSGMLIAAARKLNINLARSLMVGDKASDLAAGRQAGLQLGVHVQSGHGCSEREVALQLRSSSFEVISLKSIAEACSVLNLAKFACPPPQKAPPAE